MNLYNQLLEKEKKEKEIRNELQKIKQRKRSLEYYYKNREYVLQRQAAKKYYNKLYYKEWYNKNKNKVQDKRRNKNGAEKRVNKEYKTKQYDNSKKNKPVCFTLFFN